MSVPPSVQFKKQHKDIKMHGMYFVVHVFVCLEWQNRHDCVPQRLMPEAYMTQGQVSM